MKIHLTVIASIVSLGFAAVAAAADPPADLVLLHGRIHTEDANRSLAQATALESLNSLLANRPMLLDGADGHTVWANSAALRTAGIDAATHDPAGGRIERDASGHPTGTLRDTAAEIVLRAEPKPSLD